MLQFSTAVQDCIAECLRCHATCLSLTNTQCLDGGGKDVDSDLCRLMLACSEICATAARFLMLGTGYHQKLCALCAEICSLCAARCEEVDGMEECVQQCRRCAEQCRRMSA